MNAAMSVMNVCRATYTSKKGFVNAAMSMKNVFTSNKQFAVRDECIYFQRRNLGILLCP